MLAVTEATFGRRVLRSALPILVCFGTRACPARRALLPALERAETAHGGQLLVASVLVDQAPLLAEQYGVVASPTLMVFQHGERQAQVIGFLPEGLLQLLADEVAEGALAGDRFWSPVEERFEDNVLIPLLAGWGFAFERQAPCALPGRQQQRGRIDLLVYDPARTHPFTLIESKRQISGDDELKRAAAQATAYARSLGLGSFVIAAPRGLWLYQHHAGGYACAAHLTSLEIHRTPERPRLLFQQLLAESMR